jgi:hypothetical protein
MSSRSQGMMTERSTTPVLKGTLPAARMPREPLCPPRHPPMLCPSRFVLHSGFAKRPMEPYRWELIVQHQHKFVSPGDPSPPLPFFTTRFTVHLRCSLWSVAFQCNMASNVQVVRHPACERLLGKRVICVPEWDEIKNKVVVEDGSDRSRAIDVSRSRQCSANGTG